MGFSWQTLFVFYVTQFNGILLGGNGSPEKGFLGDLPSLRSREKKQFTSSRSSWGEGQLGCWGGHLLEQW